MAKPLLARCPKSGTLFGLDVDAEDGLLDQRSHVVYLFVREGQAVVEAPVAQCPGLVEVADDVAWYAPVGQVCDLFLEIPSGGPAVFAEIFDGRSVHLCCCPQRADFLAFGAFAEEVADFLRGGWIKGLRCPSRRHRMQESRLGCPLLDGCGDGIVIVTRGQVRTSALVHYRGLLTALAG
jgi:hypothetical protein